MSIEDNMKQITDLASQLVKEESSAINPILPQDNIFVNKGWQCPICGSVYSPTTPMCFYCDKEELLKTLKKMRTIKFRGKDVKTGEWVYIDLLNKESVINAFIAIIHRCNVRINHETVGQFTGLTDKNGKEIYEGDILRGDEYPYNCDGVDNYFVEIVWADNVCGFYRITHKKPYSTVRGISEGNWSELDEEDIKSFEVIGNIHDNPELLKGGAE